VFFWTSGLEAWFSKRVTMWIYCAGLFSLFWIIYILVTLRNFSYRALTVKNYASSAKLPIFETENFRILQWNGPCLNLVCSSVYRNLSPDADDPPDAHPYSWLPGLQLDRVGPKDAKDPPSAHSYLLPDLQRDRVCPENADDPTNARPYLLPVSSLTELVLRMPITRLSPIHSC
jgi:hypothetical protein